MANYHGIIVDAGLKDKTILKKLNVLSTKKIDDWTLYKIQVNEDELKTVLSQIQFLLLEKFYAHFYNERILLVVFNDALFFTSTSKIHLKDAIQHGISKGIPREQLDFRPYRTQDETF